MKYDRFMYLLAIGMFVENFVEGIIYLILSMNTVYAGLCFVVAGIALIACSCFISNQKLEKESYERRTL